MKRAIVVAVGGVVFVFATLAISFGATAVILENWDLMNVAASGSLSRSFAGGAVIAAIFGLPGAVLITAGFVAIWYFYPRIDVDERGSIE